MNTSLAQCYKQVAKDRRSNPEKHCAIDAHPNSRSLSRYIITNLSHFGFRCVCELDSCCRTANTTVAIVELARRKGFAIKILAIGGDVEECSLGRAKLVQAGLATPDRAREIVQFCPTDDMERLAELARGHSPEGYNAVRSHNAEPAEAAALGETHTRALTEVYRHFLDLR